MKDIKEYSLGELKDFFKKKRFPSFYGNVVFEWVYKRKVDDFESMTNLSKEARECLKSNFTLLRLKIAKREKSADGTEKFLFQLENKSYIEAVLIPEGRRNTLCISTQVGCKFRCKFCLSGEGGFKRNLKTSEIINQFLTASKTIIPRAITNIVFMGVGEPLDNFANTVEAIKLFIQPKGMHISRQRICISTCGLIPQIKELKKLNLGVKLSVSLHAAVDSLRNKLMPINKKYPLADLIKVLKGFNAFRAPLTFEYVLIHNVNTSEEDAQALGRLLRGMRYKINLIPLNYSYSEFKPPTKEEINNFTKELKKRGVFFTTRKSRGADINAACGQLRSSYRPHIT